jgi:hypothetical protein
MSTLQSTFSEDLPVGYAGMVANGETSNRISRTCADAAGIGFGKAVYRSGEHSCTADQALVGAGSERAGNTGTGTITAAPTITDGAKVGRYTITIVEPGSNVGSFMIEDPDGVNVGEGVVAVAYNAGGLAFTVADGGTDFVAGDQLYIDVTGSDLLGITIATVGQGIVAGQTADTYAQYDNVPIMTQGVIFVEAGGTVGAGQPVQVDTDGNFVVSGGIPAAGWVFDEAGVDGDIVRIARR